MSEHIEAMNEYIKECVRIGVKEERERIAKIVEEYTDNTPFLNLADMIRTVHGD